MKTQLLYIIVSSDNDIYLEQAYISMYSAKKYNDRCNIVVLTDKDTQATFIGKRKQFISFADYTSHKISLYIAAGMPVIIWEKSSLRDFIVDNHLGISVNSLFEIKNRILSLTSEEKDMILNSIHQYSITLREGGMLNKIIDKDISL